MRWPVDPTVRVLPTLTNGVLDLESWVPFGEGWEIPAGFEYEGTGPFNWTLWVQVVDGKVECLAVRAWSPDGRPITAESFRRLPLGRLVGEAVLVVSRPADEIPKNNEPWPSVEAAGRERAAVAATYKHTKRSPRDRRPITDDVLREVAEVYRANLASGAPTRAVAQGAALLTCECGSPRHGGAQARLSAKDRTETCARVAHRKGGTAWLDSQPARSSSAAGSEDAPSQSASAPMAAGAPRRRRRRRAPRRSRS